MEPSLHLDFHCPKKREDLVTFDGGLYCSDCAKPVVDFTRMEKQEIIGILAHHKEMPCVVIPQDVLSEQTPSKPIAWLPFRKSAFILALLFVAGNIKSAWTQAVGKQKYLDDKGQHIPNGFQRIEVKGTIKNKATQQGIANARITFSFEGAELSQATTDMNGTFTCVIENYGGIKELDITISAENYAREEIQKFPILKSDPTLTAELRQIKFVNEDGTYTIDRDRVFVCGAIGSISVRETTFHTPWSSHYVKPGLNDPVYYLQKVNFSAKVVDRDNAPIAHARVEIKFPKNEVRWGMTDSEGNLAMHIDLSEPALRADITAGAEGYTSVRRLLYRFENDGVQIFKLRKVERKQKLTTDPMPTPPVPAEADSVEVPTKENITENIAPKNPTEDDKPNIFPNPVKENLVVSWHGQRDVDIALMDMRGKIVLHKSVYRQTQTVLDVQTLVPGVYTIRIRYEGKAYTEKIIITG